MTEIAAVEIFTRDDLLIAASSYKPLTKNLIYKND
jgi:hypothetical protein